MVEISDISLQEKVKVYAFLKVVFGSEPSQMLLEYLQTPQVLGSLRTTGVDLGEKDLTPSQLLKIQADYTQLFIGPGKHIALNEAIYMERTPRFWGDVTVQMNKFITHLGLDLDENWTKMPDHIFVEFELMQKLLELKIKAIKMKDHPTGQQCTKAISSLFNDHIVQWVPQVCDQVIERAQTSLYKAIATWTKVFIQNESTVQSEDF